MVDKNDKPPEKTLKLVPPLPGSKTDKPNVAKFSDARIIKEEEFERAERSVVFYSNNGTPVLTIRKVVSQELLMDGELAGFWSIGTESNEKGFFVYAVGIDEDGNIVAFREEYRKKRSKKKSR